MEVRRSLKRTPAKDLKNPNRKKEEGNLTPTQRHQPPLHQLTHQKSLHFKEQLQVQPHQLRQKQQLTTHNNQHSHSRLL